MLKFSINLFSALHFLKRKPNHGLSENQLLTTPLKISVISLLIHDLPIGIFIFCFSLFNNIPFIFFSIFRNPKKIQFFFLIFVIKFQSPLASVEVEKFRIIICNYFFSEDKFYPIYLVILKYILVFLILNLGTNQLQLSFALFSASCFQ